MNKFNKLDKFKEFLLSPDDDTVELGWAMVNSEIDVESLNLEELWAMRVEYTNYLAPHKIRHNRKLSYSLVNFSSRLLKCMYLWSEHKSAQVYIRLLKEFKLQNGKV